MTGRVQSPELVARRIAASRAGWAKKTPEELALWRERVQRASYKPTGIEATTQELLDGMGIAFIIHPWVRVTCDGVRKVLRPDLVLPAYNLVIEVNGCYWHGCFACYGERARMDRIAEDEQREMLFQEQGYRVLFLWEHDIKADRAETIIVEAIEQALL